MSKKIAVLVVFTLMLSLCGCQLAQEETLAQNGYSVEDRMIGVFVTEEHLDLFDMEAYLEDNLNAIMKGSGEISGDTSKYSGRIYAVPSGYQEDGTPNGDYTFEGLEGYAYFVPLVEMENVKTHVPNADSCFTDIRVGNHVKGDNVTESTVEATMYVVDDLGDYHYYLNPVYQDENGNVYLMAGTGLASNELGTMSQYMDSELKTTIDGVETTQRYSVKITYQGVPRPETIVVLQMDVDSNVLSREEYQPGELPQQLDPVDGAEYIVLETHNAAGVTREIVSQEERWMHTYDPAESGVCEQQETELLWGQWEA